MMTDEELKDLRDAVRRLHRTASNMNMDMAIAPDNDEQRRLLINGVDDARQALQIIALIAGGA